MSRYFKIWLVMLCVSGSAFLANGQASWEQFGQNRVQYKKFEWSYFDSTHFRAFYYDQGKAHAIYAITIAEQELSRIVSMMGGRLNKKLNIIIYNSFGEYKQTNLGRKNEEINEANGGMLTVLGDNIPVYFNGNHPDLKKQIIKGITSVVKDNMLFGDSFKEVVKNSVQMNLPSWYTLGYIAYISDDWEVLQKDQVKNIILKTPKGKFDDYTLVNPTLIGHSFWQYIYTTYGEGTVSNMLYLTRYRKTVNKAIELVIRKTPKTVFEDWKIFYLANNPDSMASDSVKGRVLVGKIKEKKNTTYTQFTMSPSGREIAFVEKREGQFFIYMHDLKYGKTFKILEGGIRAWSEMADPDYPLLSWSASGKKMAILYQRNNYLYLRTYISGQRKMENKLIPKSRIERITNMCFMPDEVNMAITGIRKGQSDLFRLVLKNNRVEPITKDLYDDKDPSLIAQGIHNGILFLSNRNSSYIGENSKSDDFNDNYNLFLYQPTTGNNLLPLSKTNKPILNPITWGEEDFAYLLQENNSVVRKVVKIVNRLEGDTFATLKTKPLPFNPIKQEYLQKSAQVVEVVKKGNNFLFFSTPYADILKQDEEFRLLGDTAINNLENTDQIAQDTIPEYYTPFESAELNGLDLVFKERKFTSQKYVLYTANNNVSKPKKYKVNFYPDFLQTSIDNTLLFTRYQPYESNQGVFQNPPISGFLTSSLTDVMEDYKLTAGARLGTNFNSFDYFVQFNNYRRRTDFGLLFFHHNNYKITDQRDIQPPNFSPYNVISKVTLDYLQGNVTYPLDMLRSFRFQLGVRKDKLLTPAVDKYTIGFKDTKEFWLVSRLEYVFDNTTSSILNIMKGSRAKVFGEYQYKFNEETKGFYNFGYDGRYYMGLFRNVILASRVAGAHSGGNAKVLYLVGGVDNDVNPKPDLNSGIDTTQNYAFQSLATNLRGYRQGFRKGNSFIVLNEEIRIPLANTFTKRNIKSGFLRNLQLVLFADIGSSWNGILPNDDNLQIPSVVQGNPVNVYIDNNKYNFGLGYGTGLRTRILGYFLRTDVAWSAEGKRKPILHVSLATDF